MEYKFQDIRLSQQIFYLLLEHFELSDDTSEVLFNAYTSNEDVRALVKSQAEEASCTVERYGTSVYLIPDAENVFLGFSKQKLKERLCKSGATDKDYYLSQFAIITLLAEFYDAQGASSKSRDYMRVGELQNRISERLKEGVKNSGENEVETPDIAYNDMSEAYEALRSDERGTKAKTTKEGFLHNLLRFLEEQGLVEYIEEDEMIKTTKKLDNLMDWNLLNHDNLDRVKKVLGNE